MNQHSPDKEPLSLQIPRTTKTRLVREAQRRGIKVSELVVEILAAKTANWSISSKDYEAIRKATAIAEKTKRRLATVLDDPA
jgi:Trm5-related predicted tRNA methylase